MAVLRGGADDLLTMPSPKVRLTHDWEDEDGEEVLYAPYRALARDVHLDCLMVASDGDDFLRKYTHFYEYMKEDAILLYSYELNRAYRLRVVEYSKPQKWGSIQNGGRIVMRFSIKMRESEPSWRCRGY